MRDASAEAIVEKTFRDRFPGAIVSRVIVQPRVDDDGDRVLDVFIVFDERGPPLDRARLVGFVRHLRSRLLEVGREEFPIPSFIPRNEADKLKLEAA